MFISVFTHSESDKRLFYNYLFEERYLQRWGYVKNTILEMYPELSLQLKDTKTREESKAVIEKYLTNKYHQYQQPLSKLIEDIQIPFTNKKQDIENAFFATMSADMTNFSLEIILSLFPKSLFGEKNVMLSVASDIFHGKKRPYVGIVLHEMVHIVRNNKIREVYGDNSLPLSSIASDDLREIVAPIILRDEHFSTILDSKFFREPNQKQKMLTLHVR
ncbi:MAG: hypothetical protein LBU27_00775 [Candidatus Peribacteria bacterium]|jgi:hypothetical protein|nr:hypothetical protein [Candidatus Peribacteria bacterium]